MADQRVEDLPEIAQLAADDIFYALDASDTTTDGDADGTSSHILAATLGLLATDSVSADADINAAVGVMDVVDMSGWASTDRRWNLPTTAKVGQKCGLFIKSGSATAELDIHTTAASNDTINGVDHDTASWSRVFITGECLILRCITADTDWIVEYDGRIPCKSRIYRTTDQTVTSGVATTVDFNTAEYDIGNLHDGVDSFAIRRAGKYGFGSTLRINTTLTTPSALGAYLVETGGTTTIAQKTRLAGNVNYECADLQGQDHFSVGDDLVMKVLCTGTTPAVQGTISTSWFYFEEQL